MEDSTRLQKTFEDLPVALQPRNHIKVLHGSMPRGERAFGICFEDESDCVRQRSGIRWVLLFPVQWSRYSDSRVKTHKFRRAAA